MFAAANGVVVEADDFGAGWGNIIVIRHDLSDGDSVWSQYAHLGEMSVAIGAEVVRGEQIGTIGRGHDDEYLAHLHFEIRQEDLAADAWPSGNDSREDVAGRYHNPTEFINARRPAGYGDTEGPQVTVTSPQSGTFAIGETIRIAAAATDPSGFSHTWIELYQGGIDPDQHLVGFIYQGEAGSEFVNEFTWEVGAVVGIDGTPYTPSGNDYRIKVVVWDNASPVKNAGGAFADGTFYFDSTSNVGLDRWWATAGVHSQITVTWTVPNVPAGNYDLNIDIRRRNTWDLIQGAEVRVNGESHQFGSWYGDWWGVADLGALAAGDYEFVIDAFDVPESFVVEPITFQLREVGSGDIKRELTSLFIADALEIYRNEEYSVVVDGVSQVYESADGLIDAFAPVLHFPPGERYAVPMDVTVPQPFGVGLPGTTSGEIPVYSSLNRRGASGVFQESVTGQSKLGHIDLSNWSAGQHQSSNPGITPALYASILADRPTDLISATRLAINYYYFFPRSNWRDYQGKNTHEGDWEGFTVFFHRATSSWEPTGVAISQHVRVGGGAGPDALQNDGVDALAWEDVYVSSNTQDIETKIHLYIGLGGHATYAAPGVTGWRAPIKYYKEVHSGNGLYTDSQGTLHAMEYVPHQDDVHYLPRIGAAGNDPSLAWLSYPGYWGRPKSSDSRLDDNGPLGPAFQAPDIGLGPSDPNYGERWLRPWTWANNADADNAGPDPIDDPLRPTARVIYPDWSPRVRNHVSPAFFAWDQPDGVRGGRCLCTGGASRSSPLYHAWGAATPICHGWGLCGDGRAS